MKITYIILYLALLFEMRKILNIIKILGGKKISVKKLELNNLDFE